MWCARGGEGEGTLEVFQISWCVMSRVASQYLPNNIRLVFCNELSNI